MAQKNMTYLFHQGRLRSRGAMVWVEDHHFHSVWQRTGAAGPFFRCRPEQTFASGLAQALDLVEVEHNEVAKSCEVERIERQVTPDTGEVAQGNGFQLEVSPLFTWR